MTQQGRNMYECVTTDDKTLFVHLLVISVLYLYQYNGYTTKQITKNSAFDSEQGSTKVLGITHILL
jgi:hypothetical protein